MSFRGIQLRHIAYLSTTKPPAILEFGNGLNVVCGSSNTGKSFVVDTIDFMLGGSAQLKDIPERVGYDRILLGIEAADGVSFTLERSVQGGNFNRYGGLITTLPVDAEGELLRAKHNPNREDNLSRQLLGLIGLDERRIRRNKQGDTRSLSFRDLAHLSIIREQEIIKASSPILSGQYIAQTSDYAVFKLLLTGVDDSGLVSAAKQEKETSDELAKLEVIEQLIADYRADFEELTDDPDELDNLLSRSEDAIARHQLALQGTQQRFSEMADQRRSLWTDRGRKSGRIEETDELLARFSLLQKHYQSDLARLEAIRESGTLFTHLDPAPCPLCGANPEDQRHQESCDGDVESVVAAASAEIEKINTLSRELEETTASLQKEQVSLAEDVEQLSLVLASIQEEIDVTISPDLSEARTAYSDLIENRSELRIAVSLRQRITDLEEQKQELLEGEGVDTQETLEETHTDLSKSVLQQFAETVEMILKEWHFPDQNKVYFDEQTRDLVINGKPRASYGKGLRAITHAAYSVGFIEFCRELDRPHAGFLVLDSPLLAYREPEGSEDDLTGSDLKDKFYEYLAERHETMQVLVIENEHPPDHLEDRLNMTIFTATPTLGRYGFFPSAAE